ncbi:hypothetical protein PMAYCL1PPCAC_20036, partial [Pristionchus mayeri]
FRSSLPDRLRLTVHKRRQLDALRAMKRRDDHSDLIIRLQVLCNLPTPQSWRETLAADLPSLTLSAEAWEGRRMHFRAVHWVISTFWTQLPIEENPKVRCALLRLGLRLVTRSPFYYSDRMKDADATRAVLDLMDQRDLSMKERERALMLLQEILHYNGAEETGDRIVQLGMRMIEEHCTKTPHSVRELRRVVDCMRFGVIETYPSPSIGSLLEDDHVLPFLFDGIRCADGRLHRALSALLSTVLSFSPPVDRVTLVIRHYTQLKQAFHLMNARDLINFASHAEFAAIMATTPSLVELIYTRQKHSCEVHGEDWWNNWAYDDYSSIATYTMESVLSDAKQLENLLGYGFLNVARHFAFNRFDFSARRVNTFREILAKHPEWKGKFREMTYQGVEGNLTAELGRSIVEKPIRKACLYSIQDEEGQLW